MCENLRDIRCSSRSCGMDMSSSALHPLHSLLLRKCSHMLPPAHSLHCLQSRSSVLVSRIPNHADAHVLPGPGMQHTREGEIIAGTGPSLGLSLWCFVRACVLGVEHGHLHVLKSTSCTELLLSWNWLRSR